MTDVPKLEGLSDKQQMIHEVSVEMNGILSIFLREKMEEYRKIVVFCAIVEQLRKEWGDKEALDAEKMNELLHLITDLENYYKSLPDLEEKESTEQPRPYYVREPALKTSHQETSQSRRG